MSRITKEALIGQEPTLTSNEALAFRKQVEEEIAAMREQGIAPELPYDFD